MELRQLEYFVAVAKTLSFTTAADALHVAQSSISKAILRLEDELGATLFDRTQKPIALTEVGDYFYKEVTAVLGQLENIKDTTQELARTRQEEIRIVVPPMIGTRLVPFLYVEHEKKPQNVRISIMEGGTVTATEMLVAEEIDLGWVIDFELPDSVEFRLIEEQEWFCALPKQHKLAELDALTVEDIKDEVLLMDMVSREAVSIRMVESRYREDGHVPVSAPWAFNPGTPPHPSSMQSWVQQGMGITFLPTYSAKGAHHLAMRPLSPPLLSRVGLAWKAKKPPTPAQMELVRYVEEYYPKWSLPSGGNARK